MKNNSFKISDCFSRKNKRIGLDIGDGSIKLVELTRQNGSFVLSKLKLQEIDLQKDRDESLLETLKNLFQDIDTRDAIINVVINCAKSYTNISVIPHMPKSEILQALKWDMKNFLSFPVEEAAIDYEIIQEVTEGDAKKLKIAVACCPQETVDRNLKLLKQAGIMPSVFTQYGFSLKNTIDTLCPKESKTTAVLDIGHRFSGLLIFHDKKLLFSRKLPVGGQDFTEEMMQSLASASVNRELSFEEAEKVKKEYGIVDSGNSEISEGEISGEQFLQLLRPNLEKLSKAIHRSFLYYCEKEQNEPVETLLLLGGGGNLKNLTKILNEALHIPVQKGDPLTGYPTCDPSLLRDDPDAVNRYASALGAALAPQNSINLLPIEIKKKTQLLIKRSSIEALVTAVGVILILVYIGMTIKLDNYEKRIAVAEMEMTALSPQIEEIPIRIFIQDILTKRSRWGDALKETSNLIPEQIRLTEMSAQKNMMTLKGEIKTSDQIRKNYLTEFICTLEQGIFKEVNLISTKNGSNNELNTFELKLGL